MQQQQHIQQSSPLVSTVNTLVKSLSSILLGKEEVIRLALTCLFARGHLLIEDLPGMGKTTLAQALAQALGLEYQRIQFTSDLLPADVVGVSIYNQQTSHFEFRRGPLFTQVLLADEVNRTSPKTQSALLEAMAERQVSVDGTTHTLSDPFFVIATQNPLQQSGTFPLPESQLDRFMMRISLGYPDARAERLLLQGKDPRSKLAVLKPVISSDTLLAIQGSVHQVKASDHLLDYLQRLLAFTRTASDFDHGLSPRAAMAWLHCAKTWALVHGRAHVIPEDLQYVMPAVAGHRLQPSASIAVANNMVGSILKQVAVVE